MRKLLLVIVFCSLFSISTGFVHAVPVDISSGGVEVVGPDTIVVHNAKVGPNRYFATFRWDQYSNMWRLIDYGPESAFFSAEFYPLEVGDTWTYLRTDANGPVTTLTKTVTGTDDICGRTCMRLEHLDGQTEWQISNETGVWLVKDQAPDGSHTIYCPPVQVSNPFSYLGGSKFTPYEDARRYDLDEIQIGSRDGYFSSTGNTMETVSTPAGVFHDCFRVNLVNVSTEAWNGTAEVHTDNLWVAEGVGPVKWTRNQISTLDGDIVHTYTDILILQSATVGGVTYPEGP